MLFNPTPYGSELDSPFIGGIIDNTGEGIFLEDFEDNVLNTPFVRSNGSGTFIGTTFRTRRPDVSDSNIWGVDGDNGPVDGNGFGGDTWITIDRRTNGTSGSMEFLFGPNGEGMLPLYVGLVVTEVLDVDLDVDFGFRDADGNLLENDAEFDPKDWARDSITGQPLEGLFGGDPRTHRFVGFYSENGIASMSIQNVVQVDHLQYGFSIPEPSITAMFFLSALSVAFRRKRLLPPNKSNTQPRQR